MADKLREEGKPLPAGFSLDKCRRGGMTELEEMGLTEGQGRVLSKHKTLRSISATRRRRKSASCAGISIAATMPHFPAMMAFETYS